MESQKGITMQGRLVIHLESYPGYYCDYILWLRLFVLTEMLVGPLFMGAIAS